ncbi:acyltransferase-domain-containing protein [Collybia nuda]|uniref:Acyltransferase-domain-containing protein n=1 Tax=Collybia nuda TaxID=64659 RepID=A0A9P5XSU7_9AGAR|nr:acyltransferase-domain-containing protein [Collybia nuda]
MSTKTPDLHNLPISQRPPLSWRRSCKAITFFILFNLGCLMVNATQILILLPIRAFPSRWSRDIYNDGIHYTKGAFGCLLILMCQWFAPTKLSVTFETDGKGRFSPEEIENAVVRGPNGEFVSLNLPIKFVLIANHQVYTDWWYAWCLTYFMGPRGVHRHMYITLKKSLQWIPIVGWGMQLFNFIFLARSWASDRVHLANHLSNLARQAEEEDNPFCFILYPEGTLVSENTRPISKKFADKMGIPDMRNVLLPRSTGLHYSLRSLASRIPDLYLIDITMLYPGIPSLNYGQDFYTLRSIFMDGVSPPAIHIHMRAFNVASGVPIGDLSTRRPTAMPNNEHRAQNQDIDIPESEKEQFDEWLRELWKEKDDSITRYLETTSFSLKEPQVVEIPLKLRHKREILDAFCFFLPAGIIYFWNKLR